MNEYEKNSAFPKKIRECYDLIKKISESVGLSRPFLISNSMIFLHQYFIYKIFSSNPPSNFLQELEKNKYDLINICIACFFITTKSTWYATRLNLILDKNLEENANKVKHREQIIFYEYDILNSINFNLENDLPYKYAKSLWDEVSKAIYQKYKNNLILKDIKEKWSNFILYSYLFPFFLKFDSLVIVLANLDIVLKHYDIEIDLSQIISNHKELEFTSKTNVEVCSALIDRLIISNEKLTNIKKEEQKNENEKNTNLNIQRIHVNSDSYQDKKAESKL